MRVAFLGTILGIALTGCSADTKLKAELEAAIAAKAKAEAELAKAKTPPKEEVAKSSPKTVASSEEVPAKSVPQPVIRPDEAPAKPIAKGVAPPGDIPAKALGADIQVPAPVADWDFAKGTKDVVGQLHGTLFGGAVVKNGRLQLYGKKAHMLTEQLTFDLREKTFEAWVTLANPDTKECSVMLILDSNGTWDGIGYARHRPWRWYPGSSFDHRSRVLEGPIERAKPDELIHLAAVYSSNNRVTLFRNGKVYGSFVPQGPGCNLQTYKKATAHLKFGEFPGQIERVCLYNVALSEGDIVSLYRRFPGGKKDAEEKQVALTGTEKELMDKFLRNRCAQNFAFVDGKFMRLPPAAMRRAPESLGAIDVGAQFKAQDGYKVVKVLGPNDVLLAAKYTETKISFIGLKSVQRFESSTGPLFRLTGRPTDGLTDDMVWDGPPVLIVGTGSSIPKRGGRTVFLAVTAHGSLTDLQFGELLKQGIDIGPEIAAAEQDLVAMRVKERDAAEREIKHQERIKAQEEAKRQAEKKKVEDRAAANLKYAKLLIDKEDLKKAKERLEEIVKDFPETEAGKEAKKLLEKLGK